MEGPSTSGSPCYAYDSNFQQIIIAHSIVLFKFHVVFLFKAIEILGWNGKLQPHPVSSYTQ